MVVRELINLVGFKIDKKSEKMANDKFKKLKAGAKRVGMVLAAAIVGIGAVALKTAIDMETMTTQFEIMLGSAEKAKEFIKELTEFTAKTPFQLADVALTARRLLAAGVAADEVQDKMQILGDLAATANIPLGDMAAIFAKVKNKGKAMTEELLQMSDRGLPIISALSEEFGVAKDEIFEMASQGKISFEVMQNALKKMTSEGGLAFQGMKKLSETTAGLLSTLKDNFILSLGEAANAALPQIKKAIKKLIPILQNEFKALTTSIIQILVPILETVVNLIQPLMTLLVAVFKILIPILNLVAKIISNSIVPFIELLTKMLMPLLDDFGIILTDLFEMLEPLITILLQLFMMTLKRALFPFMIQLKLIFAFLKPLMKILNFILTPFLKALTKVLEVVNEMIDAMFFLFYDVIDKAVTWVVERLGSVGDAFKDIFLGISSFFTKIINNVIDGINFLISATNKVAKTRIELIDKLDPSKLMTKDVTNNNQKQTNVNIKNDINVTGMKDRSQVKSAIEKTAGSVFNLELKKLLIESGGL